MDGAWEVVNGNTRLVLEHTAHREARTANAPLQTNHFNHLFTEQVSGLFPNPFPNDFTTKALWANEPKEGFC